MNTTLSIIDAFASQPFTGNQAAVCVMRQPATDEWLQAFAREMGFSETAFLCELPENPDADFELRWFTPGGEVDLCGHATLATAHSLWNESHDLCSDVSNQDSLRFQTRSGILTASKLQAGWIQLDFPSTPPQACEPQAGLLTSLAPGDDLAPKVAFSGMTSFDAFLQLENSSLVRALSPDFAQLARVPVRGIIVTARASEAEKSDGVDFVSRFFAPTCRIDEDPVTGSAHCALAPFWTERLVEEKQTETELVGYQASERGGHVRVLLQKDRVLLRGRAFTIAHSKQCIGP